MEAKVQAALNLTRPSTEALQAISLPDYSERTRDPFPFSSTWLLIGSPKNGKSKLAEHLSKTFLSQLGKPLLHLDMENGAHQVHGAVRQILSLAELDRYIEALRAGGLEKYSGVTLDTTDMLAEWCDQMACTELKISGIGQADYGKDYVVSRNHFMKRIMKIKAMGKTLVLIAHTKQERREDVSQTRPNLSGQLAEMVMGQADHIGYVTIERSKGAKERGTQAPDVLTRILSFAGHEGLCAGSRYEALNGRRFELTDLKLWPDAQLWTPVFDAFKVQEEVPSATL